MRTARSLTISWGACMVGACMAGGHVRQGGMHGRGHVWQEVYMAGEHAWQGGMCGRACVWREACVAEGQNDRRV